VTLTPGGTTHRRTLRWQTARVLSVRDETPRARTFRLALPEPRRHIAGQYYVVRLTAPDGYRLLHPDGPRRRRVPAVLTLCTGDPPPTWFAAAPAAHRGGAIARAWPAIRAHTFCDLDLRHTMMSVGCPA
jgi:hypothetical protein